METRAIATCILFTTSVLGAPRLKDQPEPPTGEWVLVQIQRDGAKLRLPETELMCDQQVIRMNFGNGLSATIRVSFNPEGKMSEVDFHADSPGDMLKGIYRLEADTLTICSNEKPHLARPVQFRSDDPDRVLWTFKRVNKEK